MKKFLFSLVLMVAFCGIGDGFVSLDDMKSFLNRNTQLTEEQVENMCENIYYLANNYEGWYAVIGPDELKQMVEYELFKALSSEDKAKRILETLEKELKQLQ